MKEQEEGKPMLTKLSEEGQNALNIAAAVAQMPEMRNPYMKGLNYIEPLHLVLGLTKQPSVRELLINGGVDPDEMSGFLMLLRPLFEADYKPQSGKDGHLNDRAKSAVAIASGLAERAGRQEISAVDIAYGIIIEDREYSDPTDFTRTHETKRLIGRIPGSLLELIIDLPYRRKIGTYGGSYGKRIVLPLPYWINAEGEIEKVKIEKGDKTDKPPETSE